jgi:pimeloyl-ACP methyl ester carboxylesterase
MRLAYADEGAGAPIVLLHGFPFNRVMWEPQIAALRSTYRVIAPDLRGHGGSPAPGVVFTMDDMADDVIELVDRLQVDGSLVVGGLSMGGYVALSLVARWPGRVRGLMLLDTRAAPDTPDAAQKREETAEAVLAAGNPAALLEALVPRLFSETTLKRHPERVERLRTIMNTATATGVAGALRGMAIRPDRRADLAHIKVPTLVLVGEDDVISPPDEARELAGAIPNARLAVIPEAGHMAPWENAPEANAAIFRFLQSIDGAGHDR